MAGEVKKDERLTGSPEIKNQCEASFTFDISLPDRPYITFRCMREKHDDGKHEHKGINKFGWEYRMQWDEPVYAQQKASKEVFAGKASKEVM